MLFLKEEEDSYWAEMFASLDLADAAEAQWDLQAGCLTFVGEIGTPVGLVERWWQKSSTMATPQAERCSLYAEVYPRVGAGDASGHE
eukprot:11578167-Alexandrium_andersonii.AAC.1